MQHDRATFPNKQADGMKIVESCCCGATYEGTGVAPEYEARRFRAEHAICRVRARRDDPEFMAALKQIMDENREALERLSR